MLGATVFAGVGTGIAVAGGLCLALMRTGQGSVPAWMLLGTATLVVAIVVWPMFASGGTSAPAGELSPAERGRPAGWLRLVVCYGIFGFGYIIPATFLPVMARESIPDPAVFGWSWPVFGAAAAVSTLAATAWPGAQDNRRIWIAGALLMAVGVVLPVLVPGMAAIFVAALSVGGTFMVVTMAGMQEARRGRRNARARPDGGDDRRLCARADRRPAAGERVGGSARRFFGCGLHSRQCCSRQARGQRSPRGEDSMSAIRSMSAGGGIGPERMPPLAPEQMDEAQKKGAAELTAGPRGGV